MRWRPASSFLKWSVSGPASSGSFLVPGVVSREDAQKRWFPRTLFHPHSISPGTPHAHAILTQLAGRLQAVSRPVVATPRTNRTAAGAWLPLVLPGYQLDLVAAGPDTFHATSRARTYLGRNSSPGRVRRQGLEPRTRGLRVRCSAN